MKRLIINNHSDAPIKVVLLMIERVVEKEPIPIFNDYKWMGKSYCVVYKERKLSKSFNIYNNKK